MSQQNQQSLRGQTNPPSEEEEASVTKKTISTSTQPPQETLQEVKTIQASSPTSSVSTDLESIYSIPEPATLFVPATPTTLASATVTKGAVNASKRAAEMAATPSPPNSKLPAQEIDAPVASTTTTTTAPINSAAVAAAAAVASSLEHDNHIQFLMDSLEKLDPDKNDLDRVPEEITSSTLTTRLRAVSKINRLIDHANDLCHSFIEVGFKAKYQGCIDKFRNWILEKKIIEQIFGPNCHVEIIKQSHTILNFVAYSLNDEHVNVIWSASLLKHCGRQVLDLLTSLVRFMRTSPVLHLYWLVKNLNIEDHTDHTLLLTSHILRYIWSHSPCINQVHFCSIQKDRSSQISPSNQENDTLKQADNDARYGYASSHPLERNSARQAQQRLHYMRRVQQGSKGLLDDTSDERKRYNNGQEDAINAPTISTANNTSTDTSANDSSLAYQGKSKSEVDDLEWYNECMNQSRIGNGYEDQFNDQSLSTRSTSENEAEKDLHQSLLDAISDSAAQYAALNERHMERSNSPVSETLAKGGGGDHHEPADDVKKSVVDHILRTISADTPKVEDQEPSQEHVQSVGDDYMKPLADMDLGEHAALVEKFKLSAEPYMDYDSDVSACCSEDKNMDDFDDEAQGFIQDENTNGTDNPSANSSSSDIYVRDVVDMDHARKAVLKETHTTVYRDPLDSTSSTLDSDSKPHPSLDPNTEHFQQLSAQTVAHFQELKNASQNLSNITTQICADEDLKKLSEYNLANLSEPGKTLLWDLLQDGKVEYLGSNLWSEIENALVNLVMSFGDRFIRYKFIEACLENLSEGKSVIISLRLLPRFMSFNTMARNLSIPAVNETYTIVLWAEREHKMSENFFRNLVEYYDKHGKMTRLNHTEQIQTNIHGHPIKVSEDSSEFQGKDTMFSHIDSIIMRMSFLTFIYSKPFSPESMKLNQDQMDQLWNCLTSDRNLRCSDVLFQWIYQQAVGDDFHGVDDELLDFVLKNKLPLLAPEHFRLRGLKLLEQLLWIRQDYECCHELEHPATRLLWDIGLKAIDDEVSMSAIRILNHFYIYTNHQKPMICKQGTNFMKYCMEHLQSSLLALKSSENLKETSQSLEVMQKVILLIRTHLEVFKAHWSFYLRVLQLNNEADLISHRLNAYDIKLTMTIRFVIQAASSMNKTTLEVQANDFIGELRAEIVNWWFNHVDRSFHEQAVISPSSSASSNDPLISNQQTQDQANEKFHPNNGKIKPGGSNKLHTFTTFLLNNHRSLRLLSQNQEIPFDWDERQINELDFKDMQIIYVLNEVKPTIEPIDDEMDSNKSEDVNRASYFPDLSTIPSIVLQQENNFERLMEADRFLGLFQSLENLELTTRAKTLSRRVWEIIQILPTSPHYKESLKHCGLDDDCDMSLKVPKVVHLLSADCPQRLLYSLQIIDILKSSQECPNWGTTFIRKGGLADLYDVFMSQKLLPDGNEDWNEWLQECLAYLLKLLFQFGTRANSGSQNVLEQGSSSGTTAGRMSMNQENNRLHGAATVSSMKRMRRNRNRIHRANEERFQIPQFSVELLRLLEDTDQVFSRLIRILMSSAFSKSQNDHYCYVTMSSRAMIVHHVMSFLSSWCKSDPKFPEMRIRDYEHLLKALILDDTDSSTRREACNGFFKLHYACISHSTGPATTDSNTSASSDSPPAGDNLSDTSSNAMSEPSQLANANFSTDLLACLVKFLPIAERMKPPKPIRNCVSESDYIRELNSPGCKDYFWLTCRLIDASTSCNISYSKRGRTPSIGGDDLNGSGDSFISWSHDHEMNESPKEDSGSSPMRGPPVDNMYDLCSYLIEAIRNRTTYETRDYIVEDDTLRGMLMMMVMAIRRDPMFRYTPKAQYFITELYSYLFACPTEQCRFLPKCKSGATRSTALDLMIALVEQCPKNYMRLVNQILHDQHQAVVKSSYPTDYWPHDDCRSEVGFVGLINLGATCYLATCVQHLFMIPDLRYAVLSIQDPKSIRHGEIIKELQKIFAFLLESERKAYNPRNFCKVYTMDNHPLNIAEQTDMTEFLTDLITKIEESSPVLRQIIKSLFSGTLSNNVVSLDCPHISRTTEEFYTLRVQVADMRNLNESLDELTVKDTLEGDNMYTCSTCEKKVRAEKRACIVKLPRILCFNTMRYTFNMTTMTKEKVNTHFSFPLRLDMSDYLETNLMKRQQSSPNSSNCPSRNSTSSLNNNHDCPSDRLAADQTLNMSDKCGQKMHDEQSEFMDKDRGSPPAPAQDDCDSDTVYELIGVTVHTGNADGGHYYCFIRDCEDNSTDKPRWYLFNDAEVKPFDDSLLGAECFGGELTTKSYDAINDRYMDFSIEKTNSAYMLFYKRVDYKYRSKSVALRYLESDTERDLNTSSINKYIYDSSNLFGQFESQVNLDASSSCGQPADSSPKHSKSQPGICRNQSDDNTAADTSSKYEVIFDETLNFEDLCKLTYDDFVLPRHLANWIWTDNLKFSRDQCIFEHHYFDFMWQICANVPRTLNQMPKSVMNRIHASYFDIPEDNIAIETVHLAIIFVLGVLMNSRERPNLTNWTELIRKQFNSSRAACGWLMQLIDDDETWLKQMLMRCPIEIVRQLFHRLCNELTGSSKQHKKIRLVK